MMKNSLIISFLAIFLAACSAGKAVSEEEAAKIQTAIQEQNFTFVADRANPIRGRNRHLTSRYDVRVTADSLKSFLPYFGRAYTAPYDPTNVTTQFTSTKFTYDATPLRPGRWNVSIRPVDVSEIQEYTFTIFENGSATLSVLSTSKSPISYHGTIQPNEPANR